MKKNIVFGISICLTLMILSTPGFTRGRTIYRNLLKKKILKTHRPEIKNKLLSYFDKRSKKQIEIVGTNPVIKFD